MTITTHAAMGAFIGKLTGNPVLAFFIGMASHFLVDMIPHGDSGLSDNFRVKKIRRKQAVAYPLVDGIIAVLFVLMLANTKDIMSMRTFTWGIIGAVLPDLIVGVYDFTKLPFLKWFYKMHFFFHDYFLKKKGDVPLKYALIAQIVFIALLQTKL